MPRKIAAARRPIRRIAPDVHRAAVEQAIADTGTLRVTYDDADRPLVALRLADGRLTIEDDKGPLFPPAQFPRDLDGMVRNLKGIGVAHGLRELEGEYGISAGCLRHRRIATITTCGIDPTARHRADHGGRDRPGDGAQGRPPAGEPGRQGHRHQPELHDRRG